jgi:hypothetical protein
MRIIAMQRFLIFITNFSKTFFQRIGEAMDLANSMIAGAFKSVSWSHEGPKPSVQPKRWIKESESRWIRYRGVKLGQPVPKLALADKGEFQRFAKIVSWIIGNKALLPHFTEFLRRVERMILINSSTYTFKYLKECLRLSVRALAGSPELIPRYSEGEIRVRRDSYGIPTILPVTLRLVMHSYMNDYSRMETPAQTTDYVARASVNFVPRETQQRNIVGVLTLLSIFRVFKTNVKASVGTIIKPFDGFIRTVPSGLIHDALVSLNTPVVVRTIMSFGPTGPVPKTIVKRGTNTSTPTLGWGRFEPHKSLKAGPNGAISTWSAALDSLAFLHEPKAGFATLRIMYAQRAYLYISWFIFLNLTFGVIYSVWYTLHRVILTLLAPFPKLYYLFDQPFKTWRIAIGNHRGERDRLYCGKLSVVYDQAGKARVVASANWWTQSALHGLHRSIFAFLATLKEDGTHNQEAAFDQFIANYDKSAQMSGFDLSAATDRLPIELQAQILDACGLSGSTWMECLNVTYSTPFSNVEDSTEVKYAVGQPMGAYSSWAMLALTHHVIVKIASINAGLKDSIVNYAVLGDDVVINNSLVASAYVDIMSALGLQISEGKSVISYRFTEFAKKLRGPNANFSPIGAGAVLASCRSGYMFPALIRSALGNVILSPSEILDRVSDIPSGLIARKDLMKYMTVVLWQLLGPSSPLAKVQSFSVQPLLARLGNVPGLPQGGFIYEHVKDSLSNLFTRRIRAQLRVSHLPMVYFLLGSFTIRVSGSPFMSLLELLMKPFNPGFWIFFTAAFTASIKLDEHWKSVYDSFPSREMEPSLRAREIIRILSENSPEVSVLQLNFSKAENKIRATFFKDMLKDMNKRYSSSNLYMNARWLELPQGSQRSPLYPFMDPSKISGMELGPKVDYQRTDPKLRSWWNSLWRS